MGKEHILQGIKNRVLEIYDNKCANSAEDIGHPHKRPGLHHIIFRRNNGQTVKSNLIPLCQDCERTTHFLAGDEK